MRTSFTVIFLFFLCTVTAQKVENLIIVTTDGLRWQELFTGMDSSIARNKKFNQDDSSVLFRNYWSDSAEVRRKKLLPFLWTIFEKQGQIYGNRLLGNKINNVNPYWFSYPGYNELFTGYADTLINSNAYPPNPNTTLLDYLNKLPAYKNKVAAFCAWEAFNRIFNEEKSGVPVFAAFDSFGGLWPDKTEQVINQLLKDSYKPFGDAECLDVFTHYGAFNFLSKNKPKVLYIAYGETDEWAHSGQYRDYLNAAHQVDKWLEDIWNFIQKDPYYKDKTALLFSTDHGRGDLIKEEWTSHNSKIQGASEIWFAVMAPGIQPKGEVKTTMQLYQNQLAQTMAALLGLHFSCEHSVGEKVQLNTY